MARMKNAFYQGYICALPCVSLKRQAQVPKALKLAWTTWTVKRRQRWWPNKRVTVTQTWWQLGNWSEMWLQTTVNTLRGLGKDAQGFVRSFLWFALAVAALIRSSREASSSRRLADDQPAATRAESAQPKLCWAPAHLFLLLAHFQLKQHRAPFHLGGEIVRHWPNQMSQGMRDN